MDNVSFYLSLNKIGRKLGEKILQTRVKSLLNLILTNSLVTSMAALYRT